MSRGDADRIADILDAARELAAAVEVGNQSSWLVRSECVQLSVCSR